MRRQKLTRAHRYFLFQAAVIPAICLRVDPSSPDAVEWTEDIDLADQLFTRLPLNQNLSDRCSQILNELDPRQRSQMEESHRLDLSFAAIDNWQDLNIWPLQGSGFLDVPSWPSFGHDLISY